MWMCCRGLQTDKNRPFRYPARNLIDPPNFVTLIHFVSLFWLRSRGGGSGGGGGLYTCLTKHVSTADKVDPGDTVTLSVKFAQSTSTKVTLSPCKQAVTAAMPFARICFVINIVHCIVLCLRVNEVHCLFVKDVIKPRFS